MCEDEFFGQPFFQTKVYKEHERKINECRDTFYPIQTLPDGLWINAWSDVEGTQSTRISTLSKKNPLHSLENGFENHSVISGNVLISTI